MQRRSLSRVASRSSGGIEVNSKFKGPLGFDGFIWVLYSISRSFGARMTSPVRQAYCIGVSVVGRTLGIFRQQRSSPAGSPSRGGS